MDGDAQPTTTTDDSSRGRLRVVMPVHNAVRFVGAALQSVLDDLPSDGEVYVVDDGSSDGSDVVLQEVASGDPRIVIIRNEAATGVSRALNQAILIETCPEFVAVAEHDDLVLPGRFKAQIDLLTAEPQLGAVSSEGRYLGPSGRVAGRVSVGPKTAEEFAALKASAREILIPHPSITYRRDAVVEAGLYDPMFDSAQDLELLNRIVYQAGWEVRLLTGTHLLYRIHDASMSFSHISEQRLITRYVCYRNRMQLDNQAAESFYSWREANLPNLSTRWRWYRKDTGALRYRQAALAWLNRQPLAFLGNIAAASLLHPRWVLMKVRVARGR